MDEKRRQEIMDMRAEIEKKYPGSLVDPNAIQKDEIISTGCAMLDVITFVGGIPQGRMTEIYGQEGSGKTTIAIQTAINAQRKYPDLPVLYLDYEHALDLAYAAGLGLDVREGRLILVEPETFEEGANSKMGARLLSAQLSAPHRSNTQRFPLLSLCNPKTPRSTPLSSGPHLTLPLRISQSFPSGPLAPTHIEPP